MVMDTSLRGSRSSPAVGDGSAFTTCARLRSTNSWDNSPTIEGQNEMLEFLKLVRPTWSHPRRKGPKNIQRVVDKLKAIGVADVWDLQNRVTANTINQDLTNHGYPTFSRDTLDEMRKRSTFMRALETLTEANCRQTGLFAPVPQMLSSKNLRCKGAQSSDRPSSEPGGSRAQRLGGSRLTLSGSSDAPRVGASIASFNSSESAGAHALDMEAGGSVSSVPEVNVDDLAPGAEPFVAAPMCLRHTHASFRPTTCFRPDAASAHVLAGSGPPSLDSPGDSAAPLAGRQRAWAPLEERTSAQASASGERRGACWMSLSRGGEALESHGEAMMREVDCLEERASLRRMMETEGLVSPMRKHIAGKIRTRLLEEKEQREAQGAVELQQRCINIKKEIALMANARRDLNALRRSVESGHPEKDHGGGLGDVFGLSHKKSTAGTPMAADGAASSPKGRGTNGGSEASVSPGGRNGSKMSSSGRMPPTAKVRVR